MASDKRYHGTELVRQEERTEALDLFLELMEGCFEHLTTLSIVGVSADLKILVALLERSLELEELSMDGYHAKWSDSKLAEIVSAVTKGWKTLSFGDTSAKIGPLTVTAILCNCATLKTFG